MNSITVSAPGKLMLFGEYAVLHQSFCIVTTVAQRMFVTVTRSKQQISTGKNTLSLDAGDIGVIGYKKDFSKLGSGYMPKEVRFVEMAVKRFLGLQGHSLQDRFDLSIRTKSDFSSTVGFGSSSALTVCVIKALSEMFGIKLSCKQVFDLAYKAVLDVQGEGSGFDVAAALYGGTIYFESAGKTILRLPIRHSPSSNKGLPLVIGYSGVKADTVSMIRRVAEKAKKEPKVVANIYSSIAGIVDEARKAIEKEDWRSVGYLMNKNQEQLLRLGVSTKMLDRMIDVAKMAGSYGAKLSGAGGGDCMIALHPIQNRRKIVQAIEKVGGKVIDVETNVEGVRVE